MNRDYKKINTPVGKLLLIAGDNGLAGVHWHHREEPDPVTESSDNPILTEAEKQLNEYFEKKRRVFDIELDFVGTEFQRQVWKALLTIPFGETRTYGQIAKQIGNPGSVRAVGGAANRNPIPIIAPCHRVIGAGGKLVGFGGGLENKSFLLQLENIKSPTLW